MPRARAALRSLVTVLALAAATDAAAQELPRRPVPYTSFAHRVKPAKPAVHRPKAKPRPALAPAALPRTLVTPPATPTPPSRRILPPPTAAAPAPAAAVARSLPPPAPAAARAGPTPGAALPLAAPLPAPAAPAGARLPAGAPVPAAELEAFVDGAVRQAMGADHVAGVAVAVVQGGQVALLKGYGVARAGEDSAPVDAGTTLFRLGSVSKALTWIEVLKAVEAGKMRLDAPINTLLPPELRVPGEGFAHPIRLRDLMAHADGFESREFGRLGADDADDLRPLAEALRDDRPRRVREPGELPAYASYGAALAGEAWARATGRPFADAMDADLLRAAGMTSTTFREPYPAREGLPAPMPPALAQRLATGFLWTRDGLKPQPFEFASDLAPALSASSTAQDMARLMLLLLGDGAPAWGPGAAAALRTTLPSGGPPGLNGWAHGLMEYALPGGWAGFGHEGATLAFRAKFVTAPQLDLGVFVVANSDTGEALVHRLPEAVVQRFYGPAAPSPAAAPLANPAAYAGLYLSTRRTYHGLEGFIDRLTRLAEVRDEGDGRLVIAAGGGARRWRATGAAGRFVADDDTAEPLAFLLDRRGSAHAFLDPGGLYAAERVDGLHRPATLATTAAAALAAALLTLAGLFVRDAREYRQNRRQTAASRVQAAGAVLWIAAAGAFAAFLLTGVEEAGLYRDWPNAWLVGASSFALGATLLVFWQLWQLLGVWGDDRRLHGWTGGRKARHTLTTLVFAAFGFVLLAWGALEPWSS